MEVMGLMLGEFVDDYTVRVIDVFAMPQSGTVSGLLDLGGQHCVSRQIFEMVGFSLLKGVSVEAVDPVFQTKMLDMLKQTGR